MSFNPMIDTKNTLPKAFLGKLPSFSGESSSKLKDRLTDYL